MCSNCSFETCLNEIGPIWAYRRQVKFLLHWNPGKCIKVKSLDWKDDSSWPETQSHQSPLRHFSGFASLWGRASVIVFQFCSQAPAWGGSRNTKRTPLQLFPPWRITKNTSLDFRKPWMTACWGHTWKHYLLFRFLPKARVWIASQACVKKPKKAQNRWSSFNFLLQLTLPIAPINQISFTLKDVDCFLSLVKVIFQPLLPVKSYMVFHCGFLRMI